MRKFTATVVIDDIVTDEKIQCVSTDETYNYSKVWIDTTTGKKYYISKMCNKSCFVEIK